MPRSKPTLATIAALLTVALIVGGAGAAFAIWSKTQTLNVPAISTGDITVDSSWQGGAPQWAPLFPGESARATLIVETNSAGTTIGTKLHAEIDVPPGSRPHTTTSLSLGECSQSGRAPFPAGGYPANGYLTGTESLAICVETTLALNAPSSLQGADLNPTVTVTAVQGDGG